jgi:holin-like protein
MILLFILLFFKTLKADKIRGASDLLMRNMAFLFIPSGVGIMQIFDSISKHLLPLLAVCIISTVATFAATSYTVRGVIRIQERIGKRRERQQPLRERKDIK